jgi:putative ABC transport system permease protein
MRGVGRDLRHALRQLRRNPGFTAVVVTTLALGIGATTAAVTAFRVTMLHDFPVTEPDRIVSLSLATQTGDPVPLISGEIDALRHESRTLRDIAGVARFGAEAIPMAVGDRPVVMNMSLVTANFFQVLGARPVLGRLLRPEDGDEGASLVTVISHRAWQREFGGDPGAVGRSLTRTRDQASIAIVGVAPPGLDYPVGVDYWMPAGRNHALDVVARMAAGTTAEAARSEFLSLARVLDGQRQNPRTPAAATVRPLAVEVLGETKPILVAITAAVMLLLLIACVNVSNLLLMRTTQRARDVVVRRALGATSGGIARLFLTEAAVLGLAGGILGAGLAVWLLRILPGLAPAGLPRTEMIGMAGPPLALAVVVTVSAVLLFGIVPAVTTARNGIATALRADGRSGAVTRGRRRLRQLLVAVQVALALTLLVGAGLLVRSFMQLGALELGYDAEGVATLELALDRSGSPGPAETFDLLDGVLARVREVPGVTAATPIMSRPFMGGTGIFELRPMLEGQTAAEAEANPRLPLEVGGHELFRTLGIPIVRGRGLLESDREGAPRVAVVSQSVAERLWPGEDPIGQRMHMVTAEANWWTVVGVAGDTRFRVLREPTPKIYLHYRQLQILPGVWTVAVRSDADMASVVPAVRDRVREYDARVQLWRAAGLGDQLTHGPLAQPRMAAFLLSGFALAALLLAAIGLYGVLDLAVRERTHELGVRKALGASPFRLWTDAFGEAMGVVVVGVIAGLGVAMLAGQLLTPLLFEVGPADRTTLLAVCAMVLLVAVVAVYLPARRSTRVDPLQALRGD